MRCLIILAAVLANVCSAADTGCSINMNKDLPKNNEPLMLKKEGSNYTLVVPKVKGKQGIIELKTGEELVLACPGLNNYLVKTKKNKTTSKCVSDTDFTTAGDINIKSVDAECARKVEAEVKDTGSRCFQKGKQYQIGFKAEGWHPMITVCHDTSTANSFYSQHTLLGAALQGAEQESNRPSFSDGNLDELYTGFNPNSYYVRSAQTKLFKELFGSKSTSYIDDKNKFLSRGHLAPDGDFIFGTWQFATYFYINVAPQWQSINSGNWLTVEKNVRKLGIKLKKDLTVVTGTNGVLELENSSNKLVKVYLNNKDKKIPIPKYFWKVVYDPETKEGVGIVTSNNPYQNDTKLTLCKDTCSDNKWAKNVDEVDKGLTICCSVEELKKKITEIPFLDVQKILKGPL